MAQGGTIFYYARDGGARFLLYLWVYNISGGDVWVNFSPMWEPTGFGQSVICPLTPHPVGTAYPECAERKQASDGSSSPSPCLCLGKMSFVHIYLLQQYRTHLPSLRSDNQGRKNNLLKISFTFTIQGNRYLHILHMCCIIIHIVPMLYKYSINICLHVLHIYIGKYRHIYVFAVHTYSTRVWFTFSICLMRFYQWLETRPGEKNALPFPTLPFPIHVDGTECWFRNGYSS